MARVTIKDIARHAGVSTATVSYVVNKSRPVSPDLAERVETVIKALSYFPDDNARSLRSKQTRTIGLIVPDNANPFFAEIAKGVEDAGYEAGYSVILCNSNRMLEREQSYLEVLQSKRVDGIIFFSTTASVDQIRPLIDQHIPVVIFYRDAGDLDVDTFRIDNRRAGFLATRHLIDLGHKHIACIRPAVDQSPSALRFEGYKLALQENGIPIDPDLTVKGNNLISGGDEAVLQLLATEKNFTAIMAANDAMAIGAIRALRNSGYRVPADISVVGVDDIMLASYIEPPLTTISQPKQNAGALAVKYLIDRLTKKHPGGRRDVVLDVELVVRASTAPLLPAIRQY